MKAYFKPFLAIVLILLADQVLRGGTRKYSILC